MMEGYMAVPTVTNDGTASIVGEGQPIPQSDLSFADSGFKAYKVAQLVALTSEILEDSAVDIRKATSDALIRNTAATVDNLFYNGTGTGEPMGILNIPSLTTTALTAPVTLDNLADQMTEIESYGGTVTSILADPAAFSIIRKLKSSGSGEYFSSPFVSQDGPQQVWGGPAHTGTATPGRYRSPHG